MLGRALQVTKLIAISTVIAILTWLLSWLAQYLCAITIGGHFNFWSQATNRLAIVTIVATFAVIITIEAFIAMSGCMLFLVISLCGGAVLNGIGRVITTTFPGTTVATSLTQTMYEIFVFAWGMLVWYVCLIRPHNYTGQSDHQQE